MPIHEAVGCFADVPAEVRAAVAGLRHNAIYIVLLAVNNSVADGPQCDLHPRSRGAAPPRVLHGLLQPEHGPPRHLVA